MREVVGMGMELGSGNGSVGKEERNKGVWETRRDCRIITTETGRGKTSLLYAQRGNTVKIIKTSPTNPFRTERFDSNCLNKSEYV